MIAQQNNIQYINLLTVPDIVAISTCRGCVIEGDNYSGFNACHYTGDDDTHVINCRMQLCEMLGISYDNLIIPRQTHSLNIAIVNTLPIDKSNIENVDALVTTLNDVAIAVNTADCVPVVMVDKVAGVKAVVHSGWKGTVGRICSLTVEKMRSLGAELSRIKVVMGPCICGDCFEVGDEVVEQFIQNGFDDEDVILRNYGVKSHIDLPQACRKSLIEIGVLDENISLPTECSRCNPEKFFSARRLGINSGRTLTLIVEK